MTKTRFMQSSAAFLIWAMKPGFFNMSGKNVDYKGCHAASLQDFAMVTMHSCDANGDICSAALQSAPVVATSSQMSRHAAPAVSHHDFMLHTVNKVNSCARGSHQALARSLASADVNT